jgi:hypothetical protein
MNEKPRDVWAKIAAHTSVKVAAIFSIPRRPGLRGAKKKGHGAILLVAGAYLSTKQVPEEFGFYNASVTKKTWLRGQFLKRMMLERPRVPS